MTRVSFITAAVAVTLFTGSSPLIAQGPPQLPSQASSVAEAQFEGTLEVQIEDHAQGSIVHHFLDLPNGRLRLQVPPGFSDLDGLETGTIIRARGRLNGNTLELSSSQGSVVTMALATSNTFGEQRVIVILVNFQDNTSAPFDWTTTQMITFGDVSSFYKENSYGQTWLTGDVFGWFTLPMTSSTCDTAKISSLADQAAAKAGATLSRYTRKVYAFPQIAPCTFWGRGTVGGNPSSAWINGGYALKVVAHELGHNFGDYHSKSEPCDAGGCSLIEYGDDRDIMGQYGIGHFNAYQKERFGWLNYGSSPPAQTIRSSGSYWVESLQTPGSAPKALKILKSSTSSSNTYYYVEARSALGFDAGYGGGVILHTGVDTNGNSSTQIDLDRYTGGFDAVLDPGQSFTDGTIGLTVTTISADAAGAWVAIQMPGAAPCTARTPTVSMAPGSATTSPSVTASYSVSISNNDDSNCSQADFGLDMSLPAGWAWTTGAPTFSVAPGATANESVSVTPAASASGTATVSTLVSRSGSSGPGGSATASLTVVTACTARTPTVTISPATITTSPSTPITYSVSILNNDDAACSGAGFGVNMTVPSGWTWTTSETSKTLAPGAMGSLSVTVTPSAAATGTGTVTANVSRVGSTGPGGSASGSVTIAAVSANLTVELAVSLNASNQLEIVATVRDGSASVSSGQVTFVVTSPNGEKTTLSANVNSRGTAVVKLKLRPKDPKGFYMVNARATYGSATAIASAAYLY